MRKWWPLIAVCFGAFMLLVDVTIVVVALPSMGTDLGTDFTGLQWVMDAYALALAALLLAIGTLSDRWGLRRTYLFGLAGFAAASLACGLAGTGPVLIAARAAQGVFAAAMFAAAMALLNLTYLGRDRAVAFGIWGAVNGAAAAAGPVLGGLLTQNFGWRWVFLVNLPVSVLAIWLGAKVLMKTRCSDAGRFDGLGAVLFTGWAAATTYSFIHAGESGWTDPVTLLAAGIGVVALAGFVVVELHARVPMLDLRLFARPAFVGVMLAAVVVSVAAFAFGVYTSIWLQAALGLEPIAAGLALLPMSGAALLVSAGLARVLVRVAPWISVSAGLGLVGIGALAQTGLDAGSSSWSIAAGLTVIGVGVGVCMPPLNAAAMAAVPPQRSGMAAGALNTARQIGMALGIAALGTVFTGMLGGGEVTDPASAAAALNRTMLVAGGVGLGGAALAAVLMSRRPGPSGESGNRESLATAESDG